MGGGAREIAEHGTEAIGHATRITLIPVFWPDGTLIAIERPKVLQNGLKYNLT